MGNQNLTIRSSESMGVIEIYDKYLHHQFFDPLAKIWAAIRKEAYRDHKVDIAGSFFYDDIKNDVSCNFYLNYSVLAFTAITGEEYQKMFKSSFGIIAKDFISAIDLFIEDRTFNDEYIKLTEKASCLFQKLLELGGNEKEFVGKALRETISASRADFDRLFNVFLKDLGIRQM